MGNIKNMTVTELKEQIASVDKHIALTKSAYLKRDMQKYRRRLQSQLISCLNSGKCG